MERISTATAYNAVLANLMLSQSQEMQINAQVASGKNATDLQGYGVGAETLTAMQTVQGQVSSYLDTGQVVTAKLSSQNTGLTQVGGAATSASQAISNALASGSGDTLMQALQSAFNDAVQGLNTQFNGQYVFGGGQVNTQPVSATSLTDLTNAPSIASLFHNDQVVQSAKISANTTVQTGFLADQLGTSLFNAFQAIEAYAQGPGGPFSGNLTPAQTAFLQSQLASFNGAATSLNTSAGKNGLLQSEVSNTQTDLGDQQTTLQSLIGNITDTNMAQAASNLQQAQLALQASAKIFSNLANSSLVTLLPASPITG
jgi:flagellar hook-associated protein 3 FlgL